MRFDVPQFIEIEDKIFGPFTWRQFVYLGGGVGGAIGVFLFFSMLIPGIMAWILFAIFGLPLAVLGLALSFFPINSRPFIFFLEAIWNYLTNSRLYLWRRKANIVYKARVARTKDTPSVTPTNRGTNYKSITSLTRSLELQALQKPD